MRAYDEVAAAARFLLRNDPALAGRFQSLYALGRSRAAAVSTDASPAPDPGTIDQGTTRAQPAA